MEGKESWMFFRLRRGEPLATRVDRLARQWEMARVDAVRLLLREALLARQKAGQESGVKSA